MRGLVSPYLVFVFIGFCLVASPAQADPTDLHQEIYETNASYKHAKNYLRTGNLAFASLELDKAKDRWDKVLKTYRENPPAPYVAEEPWFRALDEIQRILNTATQSFAKGETDKARQVLPHVRTELHQLRRYYKITLFEDVYIQTTDAMNTVWSFYKKQEDFHDGAKRSALLKHSVQLEDALRKSHAIADDGLKENVIYQRLMGTALISAPAMSQSVRDRNYSGFVNYLRELKSLEQMIYLHFG
ncbi:hypothetical protein [Sneathiella aquimaris]|uniref:hypothetical protein n=1 Tax=Sneathiella aquimaris TaxID=2599305 RepID=UPI00146EB8C4|nr:hypothetical protein [Sneathiella aquimaris]